jgi:uncharacterized membrane protein YdjX (TVP38/TMEM64 family)
VPLRRFWLTCLGLAVLMLVVFAAFEGTGAAAWIALPAPGTASAGAAAAIGFLLLVLDVFLPVPSSAVMVAHGALCGWPFGTLLSTAGATAAALLGWGVGRMARDLFRRLVHPDEHERASSLLHRHGLLAIAVTRPIPILAETVALVAGASGVSAPRLLVASALGSLPAAFLYAWAGSRGLDTASDVALFGAVIAVSSVLWWLGKR